MITVPYGPAGVKGDEVIDTVKVPREKSHRLIFMGRADGRPPYQPRRVALRMLPKAFPDSVLVETLIGYYRKGVVTASDPAALHTPLPNCSELPQDRRLNGCSIDGSHSEYTELAKASKYFLVIKGDGPSTSRLSDAIHFGAVPIVISNGFIYAAMPFPKELPWGELAVFVNQTKFMQDPVGVIDLAMERAAVLAERSDMRRLARDALDWSTPSPCLVTALVTDVARRYLGGHNLMPAYRTSLCAKGARV